MLGAWWLIRSLSVPYGHPPNRPDGMLLFSKNVLLARTVCHVVRCGFPAAPLNPSFPRVKLTFHGLVIILAALS